VSPYGLNELSRYTGPDVATDGVVRWRCADLKGVIAARFAVALSERSVGRILNGRGYVRLKPRPQHPKADPAAQAAFKKTSARR
jgi:transposase